jgi:type III secretion system YscQ/HrcQ family protein
VPFLNTIFCANIPVAFNLENTVYAFAFYPEVERAQQVNYAPDIIANIMANNHRFSVGLRHKNFIDTLEGVHTHKLPAQIQCAFVEVYFSNILNMLEQWRGARLIVDSLEWKPDISESHGYNLYFYLFRRSDRLETKGHVSMSREAMQWLAEGYAQKNTHGDFLGIGRVPFELCFEIGWTLIDVEAFSRLESNDILLMDTSCYDGPKKNVQVRLAQGLCWVGNIERDTITITAAREIPMGNKVEPPNKVPQKNVGATGRPSNQDVRSGKRNQANAAAGNAQNAPTNQGQKEPLATAVIDGLNIDLVFEVGRWTITLQDLKKIKPGYTFDLATPLDRSISVVANGKTVGKGTLVQIDQRFGVQLMEIIS